MFSISGIILGFIGIVFFALIPLLIVGIDVFSYLRAEEWHTTTFADIIIFFDGDPDALFLAIYSPEWAGAMKLIWWFLFDGAAAAEIAVIGAILLYLGSATMD